MRQTSFRMSGLLYDRLIAISSRLNLSLSEVIMRLVLIGLDTSNDLALTEPSSGGMVKYERHGDKHSGSRAGRVPDSSFIASEFGGRRVESIDLGK